MRFEDYLLKHGKAIEVAKNDYILRQGEPCGDLYFIRQGILKAHYLTLEGKEFVKSFLMEGDLIGSLSAAYEGELASFSVISLEDSHLIQLNFNKLMEQCNDELALARDMIEFLLLLAMKKEKREYEFLCLTPEARYDSLARSRPELLERVTQQDIAAYLGVTAVGLSRILKRRR